MKNVIFLFSFVASSLASFNLLAETEVVPSNLSGQEQLEKQSFSEDELAQILAPIALYPDSLLTHILIASTYPIEIVEAHRWLIKNDELSADQLAQSVKDFDWDASVKALVPFERILSRLSEDLTWTQQLGDAFLQDESRLLDSIQVLRKRAELAGNLEKMDNMDVSYEKNNIVIEPIEKEIVYVPYYDTRIVYGTWHSTYYPPVYWKPHHRVYVSHYSPFYWHSGVHISFNYFFSAFHWHNRHVVVVNSHHSKHRYYKQRPRRLIVNGGYAKRWEHQPIHRKGVAYRTKVTRSKYVNKQMKVRESNNKQHHVLQSKIKRNGKKTLSVVHHKSNKRAKSKVQTTNKRVVKPTSKKYADNDNFQSKPKKLSPKKAYRSTAMVKQESSKKLTHKSYEKRLSKHATNFDDRSYKKKNYSSKQKQKHRSASVKKNNLQSTKKKHK